MRLVLAFVLGVTVGLATHVTAEARPEASTVEYCVLAPLEPERREAYETRLADRRRTPATERADAALTLAGYDIAAAIDDERRCRKAFERGASTFERTLRKKTREVSANAGKADSQNPEYRTIQQLLRDAFIADQAARLAYLELTTADRKGAEYWAQRLATARAIRLDAAHTRLLKDLLADHDWIDATRFGPRSASHAWVIAQHADAEPEFQRDVLERMARHLETGGVRQRDYAYLYDRVAVNTGGLQRYGTQPMSDCNADGSLSPRPLEDPEEVDERRAELDMEPMADAMAEMAARRCRSE